MKEKDPKERDWDREMREVDKLLADRKSVV